MPKSKKKGSKVKMRPIAASPRSDVHIAYDEVATDLQHIPEEAAAVEERDSFLPAPSEDAWYLEPMSENAAQLSKPAAAGETEALLPTSSEGIESSEPAPVEVSSIIELDRTEGIEMSGDSDNMEPAQHATSPYESEAATILIGRTGKRYMVPLDIVNRVPSLKWHQAELDSKTVRLRDVDHDIGHTFIHYLYTGDYQTLQLSPECNLPRRVIEYNRSVLVYRTAMNYGLGGLAAHAKKYMQLFDDGVSIFHMIALGRQNFPKITEDIWFAEYLASKIMDSFEEDERPFQREEFFEGFGEARDFDKFLGKLMAYAYSQRMLRIQDVAVLATSNNKPSVMNIEDSLASSDTTPDQRVRNEQSNLPQGSSDVGTSSTGDDMWIGCEDYGNSIQIRVMTPSSSVGESSEERQVGQPSPRELQQSKADLGNRVCPLWLQHSMREDLWRDCPKCKSHMVSIFAKLLLNDA